MNKNRVEAFSDGVVAIVLTIMVLDLKVPHEPTLEALAGLWPIYVAYALSYLNVFLLWLNHHDIFAMLERVDRPVLTANGLLLFASSLIPFATAFAGHTHWVSSLPAALYGLVMTGVSLAFSRLRWTASRCTDDEPVAALQRHESLASLVFAVVFLLGAAVAAFMPLLALLIYVLIPVARMLMRRHREKVSR